MPRMLNDEDEVKLLLVKVMLGSVSSRSLVVLICCSVSACALNADTAIGNGSAHALTSSDASESADPGLPARK